MSDETISPLVEADPAAIDFLLDRITDHIALGTPEKIKSEKLFEKMIAGFRAQAEKWQADEIAQVSHKRSGRKANPILKIELENLL